MCIEPRAMALAGLSAGLSAGPELHSGALLSIESSPRIAPDNDEAWLYHALEPERSPQPHLPRFRLM